MNANAQTGDLIPVSYETLTRSFLHDRGKTFLLYGGAPVFKLSLLMAAYAVRSNGTIAVVDGCNRFDIHTIIRYAQEQHLDPDLLLGRVFISRGFTCYQMEAAIRDKLPAFLARTHSRRAIIFGLLDTFYDEQAPLREVTQMLNRLVETFREMALNKVSLLLACNDWNVLPPERNQLFATLRGGVDRVYRFSLTAENRSQLFLEAQPRLNC